MAQYELIDTFPAFLAFWEKSRHKPAAVQIADWAAIYMDPWPELLHKQVDDATSMGMDWREIALEHVFPYLEQRLPDMKAAHSKLPAVCKTLCARFQERIGLDNEVVLLIYVGTGCGAGWVTTYDGKPAILFGLENIAEEGWTQTPTLEGLAAHEFGHVAHFQWREQAGLADGEGPWWQLYTEGFAQWCEHLFLGRSSWHMHDEAKGNWLGWCEKNRGWLAAEFLRRVDAGESVRPFFGSWFDLQGYKQTGYFLGYELIKSVAAHKSLREIALLEDSAGRLRQILEKFSSVPNAAL